MRKRAMIQGLKTYVTTPHGVDLSISLFRGKFHVAAKDQRGTFHSIGGFSPGGLACYAFADGVKVGSKASRTRWVEFAATTSNLPTVDVDRNYKGSGPLQ
jgi:hypothetical protein